MGKKVKRKTYVSKGERHSVARSTVKAIRQARTELEKGLTKLAAWRAGKNPWVTVPGPSSNMRMIRVRANTVWGDPRRTANIYKARDEE